MTQRDAVIVGAVRTAIGVGKPGKGALHGIHPVDISALVLTSLLSRAGVEPSLVDDVIWGCVSQIGEQTFNLGRNAVLAAGWPETVPATTIDRQCGSSQQAVHFAAAGLIAGHYDLVVAGGVEMMSRVPLNSSPAGQDPFGPRVAERYAAQFVANDMLVFNQGIGAELIADRWGLSRTQLDEYSVGSHLRAAEATSSGTFTEEIVPVPTTAGDFGRDQGIRPDSSVAGLAGLKTPFKPDGVVTAGNASQISDGSAALLLTTSARAAELGLRPWARIHTAVLAGADPIMMLTAPIPATAKALARAGLGISDIGTFEVNEAFAAVPLAWLAETGADPGRLNSDGGAIALGHPLGASGARLMTTLVHRMRRMGVRYGLQTMCEGGGMANATVLELS